MTYRSLSIRNKMLIVMLPLLLGMVIVGMFIINRLSANALEKNLYANLRSLSKIAGAAARTGLEFDDPSTVADALKAFTEDEQLAYLQIIDAKGNVAFNYRKTGLPAVNPSLSKEITQIGEEIFTSHEITSGGDNLGKVILSLSLRERDAALSYSQHFLLVLTVLGLLLLFAAVILLSTSISKPIRNLVQIANEISEGNLQHQIPITGDDEIGQLAAAFNSVLTYISDIATVADKVSQGDLTTNVQVRSQKDILSLSFNRLTQQMRQVFGNILNFSASLSETVNKLNRMSEHLAGDSQNMRQSSDMVATATQEMNDNIHTLETNMQEMNHTIEEIARNAERASTVTQKAVETTGEANKQMNELNQTSQEINKVIEVIIDIAEQTKLLALNATIEAARAGEAGKGFAVVANEVKDLAQQTNKATEDISKRLQAMQHNTGDAVQKIEQVGLIVNEVNEMVTTIAAAVEEQNVTTRDVAHSIAQAAQATGSIAEDMQKFSNTSEVVEQNSAELQRDAVTFDEVNRNLTRLIEKFKVE